ncbi:glycosyltransferase [Leifsonia sp. H3M29-4]|uniref:glycosyltransferase n=1 Tax=Salinibacterium metalliresistens TaxID=3031321 RepID=UPI0023DBEE9C|nr:glycosyltransferase [Salinibacterium metalliresistens]MDF1479140.1 glycosyltransferase [Salinibacterium metalliresistens]
MTTLRVILDEMLDPAGGELSQYAGQVAGALIRFAPPGCTVDGFVPSSPESDYDAVRALLPGLGMLHKSSLARRELAAAWQHGFTRVPGGGMLHAPSLMAPLARHDRLNDQEQVVVTLYDTLAWTDPEALSPREVSRQLALAKRAERYADAVVVPSHAVAARADEFLGFGDRIRVIPGGESLAAELPEDSADRLARASLPERYLVAVDGPGTSAGIRELLAHASALPAPLVVVAAHPFAGAEHQFVTHDPHDLAAVISQASALIHPAVEVGFGMPVLDALALGTPVVHSDAPALVELTAGAASVVERGAPGYPERLADAARAILEDETSARHLRYAGEDRARAFSWRSAAEKIWQLHADL